MDAGPPDSAETTAPVRDEQAEVSYQEDSSSGSGTPNSTSTYGYSHEPYETFQDKVIALARDISDCEEVSLQRQRGGSYNRVVIAELTKGGQKFRGIFRIPRFTDVTGSLQNEQQQNESGENHQIDEEVQDQAAVLQFLAPLGLSAPALAAFDASAENAISSPYVFQECSTGTPLDKVYGSMSHAEKLCIADELVRILIAAEERTSFPRSGIIVSKKSEHLAKAGSWLFGEVGSVPEVDVKDFSETPATTLSDFLYHLLEKHLDEERSFGTNNPVVAMWERLYSMHGEMQTAGVFDLKNESSASISRSILYHWDLEPRNILVKPTEDGKGHLFDMVIDWDRVQAVPAILTRKPPVWLWDFSDDSDRASITSDYDGDVDLFDSTRYDAAGDRLSADDLQIKQRFEDRLVGLLAKLYPGYDTEAYQEEAYGSGRWIRRLARFAIHGASDSQDLTRFEHLDKDWSVFSGNQTNSQGRDVSDTKED